MLNLLELLLIEITEKLHGGNIKSMLTFFFGFVHGLCFHKICFNMSSFFLQDNIILCWPTAIYSLIGKTLWLLPVNVLPFVYLVASFNLNFIAKLWERDWIISGWTQPSSDARLDGFSPLTVLPGGNS